MTDQNQKEVLHLLEEVDFKFDKIHWQLNALFSEDEWKEFRILTQRQFIAILKRLSKNVKLSRFLKHPRGPKKPAAKRTSDRKHPHVSTAKLLAERKK